MNYREGGGWGNPDFFMIFFEIAVQQTRTRDRTFFGALLVASSLLKSHIMFHPD